MSKMIDIEKMASFEEDVIKEEQINADNNYSALELEWENEHNLIPYPETTPYTTGSGLMDIDRVQWEKKQNRPHWDKCNLIAKYRDNDKLYKGHVNRNGVNYYFMESITLDSRKLSVDNDDVYLVNTDDKNYIDHIKWWRNPEEDPNVSFSRNILLENKRISAVDIRYDKSNELYSKITDNYLRQALKRNKDKQGIQSIIQTIQDKQDYIRVLPKERSFIVQGCAGSGKTMVLLHRLRYLLFNREISAGDYIFLIPGQSYKDFISDISIEFKIGRGNIITYQEYYKSFFGKKGSSLEPEFSEVIFDFSYLERIYSESFIKEAYSDLFDLFAEQTDLLVSLCDDNLNKIIEQEKEQIITKIESAKSNAVEEIYQLCKNIQPYLENKNDRVYETIPVLISEIEEKYSKAKTEYESVSRNEQNIVISPDDDRILKNEHLKDVLQQIEQENVAIEKASVFTVASHKRKLKILQDKYDLTYLDVVKKIEEEEKEKLTSKVNSAIYVFEGISIDDVENILKLCQKCFTNSVDLIEKANTELEVLVDNVGIKYSKQIEALNELISLSTNISIDKQEYLECLKPSYDYFELNTKTGNYLLNELLKSTDEKEAERIKKSFSFFTDKTDERRYSHLNSLIFNAFKKKIKKEFDIKICEKYKHYWYLNLYSAYLSRPIKNSKKYIFVDEAQDLSVSELNLIYKINSLRNSVVMNLFGDTNQTITQHGISDWTLLDSIVPQKYFLEENFRNTNQIVDYCNKKLSMDMTKIGVDMYAVREFVSLNDAIELNPSILNNAVFIVKDEYSKSDLETLLSRTDIKDFEIYTIKMAKGLEFKETFVFEKNMSRNEKYIAYTRALANLNVILELPEVFDRSVSLIEQGTDEITEN